jgi:glycosyltransferase involved in cell wall biosynthesis
MKIALLGPSHPFRGGIVHFNSRLAEILQNKTQLDVDLFFWLKLYPSFLLPGSTSEYLDEKSAMTFSHAGLCILNYTNPMTWIDLVKYIRRGQYDLFITHWVHPVHFPVFKFLFAAIKLTTKTKICLIVHNCLPHERFSGDKALSRNLFNMVHRVIMHGNPETDLATRIGVDSQRLITAFHPLYNQFSPPDESRESIRHHLGLGSKVLLFFGFIRPYKGLDLLLKAFCELSPKYDDVSLLIVGEQFGCGAEHISEKDKFLNGRSPDDSIRSRIVWVDRYVANEEVGRYFTVADVLVAPYLSVTQSGPIQIAYAFDKPVIASDLPAFRECVSHGESGYLFERGNASDLARKIELFLGKPISSENVKFFRQKFGWDAYVELILGGRTLPVINRKPLSGTV